MYEQLRLHVRACRVISEVWNTHEMPRALFGWDLHTAFARSSCATGALAAPALGKAPRPMNFATTLAFGGRTGTRDSREKPIPADGLVRARAHPTLLPLPLRRSFPPGRRKRFRWRPKILTAAGRRRTGDSPVCDRTRKTLIRAHRARTLPSFEPGLE